MDADPSLEADLAAVLATRDRDDMTPTISALLAIMGQHPDSPLVLFEVGGAYDGAGQPAVAVDYYEQALELGLDGEVLCRCYLQYGSTLKNLGRIEESVAVFAKAREEFPESLSLVAFEALTSHAAGRHGAALGSVLRLVADHVDSAEISRYEISLRAYADEIADLDDAADPNPHGADNG